MPTKKTEKLIETEVIDAPVASPDALGEVLDVRDDQISVVRPAITPAQARDNWQLYTALCTALLDDSDYYTLGKKKLKLKSAWRKLATAFNLSTQITDEKRINLETYFVVQITVRATAPNGRTVDGTGSCASNERSFAHVEHDVRAMAETRAKNRAISDMIGGGELSAEELQQIEAEKNKKLPCTQNHEELPVTTAPDGRAYKKCPLCFNFEWMP